MRWYRLLSEYDCAYLHNKNLWDGEWNNNTSEIVNLKTILIFVGEKLFLRNEGGYLKCLRGFRGGSMFVNKEEGGGVLRGFTQSLNQAQAIPLNIVISKCFTIWKKSVDVLRRILPTVNIRNLKWFFQFVIWLWCIKELQISCAFSRFAML